MNLPAAIPWTTWRPRLLEMLGRLNVDQDIPENMFAAVAVILSWVYWLRGMVPGDEKKTGRD